MRNALAHAGKSSRRVVSAFVATAFAQDSADAAKAQWRRVADQLRLKLPKLAAFMDEAEGCGRFLRLDPVPPRRPEARRIGGLDEHHRRQSLSQWQADRPGLARSAGPLCN
jgi:hypothetical protein